MSEALLLGTDVGTTGVRSAVFDTRLRPVGSSYRECPPRYRPGGVAEQDPEEWVDAVAATARAATAGVADRVVALAVSSQGITLVPVDASGAAVRPALSWLDRRGDAALAELAAACDPDELRRRTWKPFDGGYTLPKALWLRSAEPDAWSRVRALLTPHDYVIGRLCGRPATDATLAGGTMAYDVGRREWDAALHDSLGLDAALWPPVLPAGTPAGGLHPEAAALLGLPPGIVVAVGGQDQKVAALAAGLAPGTPTLSLGTAAALSVLHAQPGAPVAPEAAGFGALLGDAWIHEAAVLTAGAALRWLAATAAPGVGFADLGAEAAASYPQGEWPLFYPFLGGPPGGAAPAGAFWGLTLDVGRGDLVRAVIEGITFEVERLRRAMGGSVDAIRVFGGGASSPFWCRVIADVMGCPVQALATHEAAVLGAAMLAGLAAGAWPSPADAARHVRLAEETPPDAKAADQVAMRFDRWVAHRSRMN